MKKLLIIISILFIGCDVTESPVIDHWSCEYYEERENGYIMFGSVVIHATSEDIAVEECIDHFYLPSPKNNYCECVEGYD